MLVKIFLISHNQWKCLDINILWQFAKVEYTPWVGIVLIEQWSKQLNAMTMIKMYGPEKHQCNLKGLILQH